MIKKIKLFFSKKLHTKIYQIIVGIVIFISAVAIIITPILVKANQVEQKYEAQLQIKNILLKDHEEEIKQWKEQTAEIMKVKTDYSKLLKEVVDMLYFKDMPMGGNSGHKIEETDQITIKMLRDTIDNFKEEKDWMINIKNYLIAREKFVSDFPFIYPVQDGAPARISSEFGYRKDVFGEDQGLHFHTGIDIPGKLGEPIIATADGTVIYINNENPIYGIVVVLKHEMGFLTYYAHLNGFIVRMGEKVKRGQVIGSMGETGLSKGVHLHYEVRVGETMDKSVPKDPMIYMTSNY